MNIFYSDEPTWRGKHKVVRANSPGWRSPVRVVAYKAVNPEVEGLVTVALYTLSKIVNRDMRGICSRGHFYSPQE